MILEKMRSCLWKLELWFWTYSVIRLLPKALVPIYPKLVLGPRHQMYTVLRSKYFFMSSSIKFWWSKHLFSNFRSLLTKLWVFLPRKWQNSPSKFFFLVPFQICTFPLSLVWKYPLIWSTKIQISSEPLGQI